MAPLGWVEGLVLIKKRSNMAGLGRTMALSDGNWLRQLYNMLDFSIDDISATRV